MKKTNRLLVSAALLLACAAAPAGVIWDEGLSGDLSDIPAAPTALALGMSANTVRGLTTGGDPDLFSITVSPGEMLSRIVVDAFAGSALSFIAIQGGATWTEGVGGAINPANLLGWAHVAPGDVGSDIMGAIGAGAGAIGFAAPLGPGVYSLLFQETGPFTVAYDLRFQTRTIPEPATLTLIGLGLLGMMRGQTRRSI